MEYKNKVLLSLMKQKTYSVGVIKSIIQMVNNGQLSEKQMIEHIKNDSPTEEQLLGELVDLANRIVLQSL